MPLGSTLQMLPKQAARPRKKMGRPKGSGGRGVLPAGRFSGSYPMTIVTYRHQPKRKRPAKAVPAAITGPRIVSAKGPSKGRKAPVETVVDPESEARVAEFFKRMIRPL
jgi:hypothetical protein